MGKEVDPFSGFPIALLVIPPCWQARPRRERVGSRNAAALPDRKQGMDRLALR